MSRTLPAFRLRPPPLPPAAVHRTRLLERILSVAAGQTCVLTAAQGYGATTALVQATAHSADPVHWVALDPTVGSEQAAALLSTAVGAKPDSGLDGVLTAVSDGRRRWVVVDGLDPLVHALMARDVAEVAARLPGTVRLAVATHRRFDVVARAVAIDERDLSFEVDEAFEVIQGIVPGVDVEDVGRLIEAADGWAAALVAGAMDLSAGRRCSVDELASLLLGGWFERLPERQRGFLHATAVLEELSAGPADAVCAQAGAGEVLLELEAHHAHLRPVDTPQGHSGRWWVRHPLLTTYLLQRTGPQSVAAHSAAADWFIATEDVPRALHHLVASGRVRDAGEFLTAHESALFSAGRAGELLQWYDQVADNYDDRIEHLLRVGWGQALSGDVRGADASLGRLSAELAARGRGTAGRHHEGVTPGGGWAAEESLLGAYLAGFHADPDTMISEGRRAMSASADLTGDAEQLAPLLVLRGMLWSGQAEQAARLLAAVREQPFPNDVLRETHLAGLWAQIDAENGFVEAAAVRADAALTWLARVGQEGMPFAPRQARAGVALAAGDLDTALRTAERLAEEAEAMGSLGEAAWAMLTAARVHTVRGDFGAALWALGQGRALAVSETPGSAMAVPLDQTQALVHLAAGDPVRAERAIRRLPPSPTRSLLWARAGLARQPAVARRTLEGITAGTPRVEAERHLLLACVHVRTSRRMAQGHLRKAAAVARAHGLGNLLSPPEAGLVELARETALEYQDDDLLWLLDHRRAGSGAQPVAKAETPLSRGELQLLALLPTRAKNAAIAATLGVSVNTVKTRLRRLYVKLDAGDRDEAIARARERGLMERG